MGRPGPVHRCLAPLIVLLLFYRDAAGAPLWCVASPKASEAALQEGLNFACGQGGADCSPIQHTLRDHASYAYNSYFNMKPLEYRCDFNDSAILTKTDPSTLTCKYPKTGYAATSNTSDHTGEIGDKA